MHNTLPKTFQFTHPVWGATQHRYIVEYFLKFQFTHPVWGATGDAVNSDYI